MTVICALALRSAFAAFKPPNPPPRMTIFGCEGTIYRFLRNRSYTRYPFTMQDEASLLKRDWKLFITLTALFSFGFAVYSGVFQNFLRDVLHAGPQMLGNLESTREIPGLLAALMAGTLVALAESRVAALGLAITAIGIGLSGSMGGYWPLVGITVFWSVGFHLY